MGGSPAFSAVLPREIRTFLFTATDTVAFTLGFLITPNLIVVFLNLKQNLMIVI